MTNTDPDRLYWDDHVLEGIEARKELDGGRWKLGDLACAVETTYGAGDLQRYAEAVGVSYSTLRRYRDVARAYEVATRVADATWSHYRVAAALPDREELLQRAAGEGWTVERLQEHVRGMDEDEHAAFSNLEDWFYRRHILLSDKAKEKVLAVCRRRGVLPLIEDLRSSESTIPYVWAGYVEPGADEWDGGSIVYHAGWAEYCRLTIEKPTWADARLMPMPSLTALPADA